MKVVEIKKVDILATVEFTEIEMRGLVKMIGPTSPQSRIHDNDLTEKESAAMDVVYSELSDIVGII